jgi:hypothetical protein
MNVKIKIFQNMYNSLLLQAQKEGCYDVISQKELIIDGINGPKTQKAIDFMSGIFSENIEESDEIQLMIATNEILKNLSQCQKLTSKMFSFNDPPTPMFNRRHPRYGQVLTIGNFEGRFFIPAETTKWQGESYYGGDKDSGDRMYGQANLDRQVKKPSEIKEVYKDLDYLFDLELAENDEWADIPEGEAGLSYYLNEEAFYGALYLPLKKYGYKNEKCLKVLVENPRIEKACVIMIIDHGPHPKTNRQVDLSPGAYKFLDIKRDVDSLKLAIVHPETTLGPALLTSSPKNKIKELRKEILENTTTKEQIEKLKGI